VLGPRRYSKLGRIGKGVFLCKDPEEYLEGIQSLDAADNTVDCRIDVFAYLYFLYGDVIHPSSVDDCNISPFTVWFSWCVFVCYS